MSSDEYEPYEDDDDDEPPPPRSRHSSRPGAVQAAYAAALGPLWTQALAEARQANPDLAEFKNQQLPLARIKKIMKSDEDVRMISAEAPVLFAKACELFILELTLRAWVHAEDGRRRTLQRSDVAAAVANCEFMDFLADIVPQQDDSKPDAGPSAAAAPAGATAHSGGSPSAAAAAAAPQQLPPAQQQQQQQQPGGVLYTPSGLPYMPATLPAPDGQVPSPTVPQLDAQQQQPVQVALFQQWQAEGQAQAAAPPPGPLP